ncbi:MAG: tetratricopeptide repeat protein [Planctomycetota bacterium]
MIASSNAFRVLCLVGFALALGLMPASLLAQSSSTLLIGDDLADLRGMAQKNPANIGMRMRLVQRMLSLVTSADNVRARSKLLEEVEKELEEIRKLDPKFPYPYRSLARLYYRRGKNEELIKLLDAYSEIGASDQEMKSLYVRNLLRMATRPENPQPRRKKEAAAYVGDWLDSGEAPSFGQTLGACAVWLIDREFREELLATFSDRYEKDHSNLNLVISYAACLQALGRNESAWKLVKDAEQYGLSDTITGSRHPVAHLLQMQCPEVNEEGSYWDMDVPKIDELMKAHPKNASFPLRAAIIHKRRGDTASRLKLLCQQKIEFENEKAGGKAPAEAVKGLSQRCIDFEAKARNHYKDAIPYALRARELNPKLEATLLVLGDAQYKIGKLEEAVRYFNEGLVLVPFYLDLREGLAQVYVDQKNWSAAAEQLAVVCKSTAVDADGWDDLSEDSLIPVPRIPREKLMVSMAENPEARKAMIAVFEKAAAASPKNPNLPGFLAMIHFFGKDKSSAQRWMMQAERVGLCGEEGSEHPLASYIDSRERW